MAILNKKESNFKESIKDKVKIFDIKVTAEEIKKAFSGVLVTTKYNNRETEIVDSEVERLLVRKSFNYFVSRYATMLIPGKGILPFDMYYAQKKVVDELNEKDSVIFLKSRQVGISTICSIYSLWKMLDETQLHSIDIISATAEKAKEFKSRMGDTLRNLPLFLFPKIRDTKTGEKRFIETLRELPKNNKTHLEFCNGSKFKCETASEGAGRGDALSLLILDEAAHFRTANLVEEIWKSASPALSKTKGKAIIISTPRGTTNSGEWYYKKWQEAIAGNTSITPITIDWWEIPDEDKGNIEWLSELVKKDYYKNPKYRKEGEERAKYEEENLEGNKWLKRQYDEMGPVSFRQEILHDFIITGESVFPTSVLEKIKAGTTEPLYKNVLNGYQIKGLMIWEIPNKNRKYIMGVDSARGSGRDASAIQVLDATTYAQVAEYKSFVDTKRLGFLVKKIARYYNDAYTVIECNNLGEATFNEVYLSDSDPYDNVYKKNVTKNGRNITMGWDTTPSARILMTEEFINYVVNEEFQQFITIRSERLYAEMMTWVFEGSKPVHAQGMHDDLIIAFCLAFFNRKKNESKNAFIVSTNASVDYSYYDARDIELMKTKKALEQDMDIEELMNERKRDAFVQRYNVDYEQYSWLLGIGPNLNKDEDSF